MDKSQVGRIEAWVGLDVGKTDHHAAVVSAAGEPLFERSVQTMRRLSSGCSIALSSPDRVLVIDQPGSIGLLAICLARRRLTAAAGSSLRPPIFPVTALLPARAGRFQGADLPRIRVGRFHAIDPDAAPRPPTQAVALAT